ncbi:MAG: Two-component sensor histidine kinase, partial [Mucilaginibacter sp.]|nr:Two-component sensor histidine kinase [Mucilaginibacter sp.]
ATAVYTTEELIIQTANDAMIRFWGKDRSVIGKSLIEAVPELVGQPFFDLLKEVWRTGITYTATDMPARLRINDELQWSYYDFEYRAIKNEQGNTYCILHTATDVTAHNLNRSTIQENLQREQILTEELAAVNEELASTNEELNSSNEELLTSNEELSFSREKLAELNAQLEVRVRERIKALEESEASLRTLVMTAPYALMILRGRDWIIELVNWQMANLWDKTLEEVTGKPLLMILPELEGQPFPDLLKQVYETGVAYGQEEEVFFLNTPEGQKKKYVSYHYDPMFNQEGLVTGIIVAGEDITEKVEARHLLEKSYQEQQVLNEALAANNEELLSINERLAVSQKQLKLTINRLETSEARIRYMLADAPVAISILSGRELIVESANRKMLEIWGKTAAVIGVPLAKALPELDELGQPFLKILDDVMTTGQAFYANEIVALLEHRGVVEEIYVNFVYYPVQEANGTINSIIVVATDVTEQVKSRQLIEATGARFRFLLNAIPQQVWTAAPDGTLNYVNQVVCDNFGYNSEEIVGHGWKKFIHPDDLAEYMEKWIKAVTSGTEYVVEFRLLFKDNTYKWHLARALPLIEEEQVTLWLGTNTNIEIQKSNEQKKDEFLSIASHELKTPLTSIKAVIQMIQRYKDPAKLEPFIKKSAEHIARLEKLINDLLDVTKINAGKIIYNMEPFGFIQMLRDSIANIQYTAAHELILESNEEITYTGDRFRLEQVMNNFLTNAIKYSPGADKVIIRCKTDQEGIIVSVQDFGIGIEPENLDRLFDRYYRVDNTAMRFEGLGLGLFISAEIIKRHNGSFWIESEPDKGSIFYFRLPLSLSAAKQQVVQTDTFYRANHLTISYNQTHNRLDVDWIGFQDVASVKKGCMLMLDYLIKNHCDRVVNDNRHVLGNWSEAVDWVGNTWFPMMEKAGLRYFAHLLSPSTFSRLSAKKSIDMMAGIITTQYFTEIEQARKWINERPS